MSPSQLATPGEIARAYGTTIGYVYKLASLKNWRKAKHEGRVYYLWADADANLGKD